MPTLLEDLSVWKKFTTLLLALRNVSGLGLNSNHTNDPGYYKQSKGLATIILENTITEK